jgi:hypothetical protein
MEKARIHAPLNFFLSSNVSYCLEKKTTKTKKANIKAPTKAESIQSNRSHLAIIIPCDLIEQESAHTNMISKTHTRTHALHYVEFPRPHVGRCIALNDRCGHVLVDELALYVRKAFSN